jgi:hypothetical protein
LALLLCGCAHTPQVADTTPLNRAIPTQTCEQILRAVPLPKVTAETDAREAFIRDDAALLNANGRINAGRNCIVSVRTDYAAPKSGPTAQK